MLMETKEIKRDADGETRKEPIRQQGHSPNTEAQRVEPANITAQNTTTIPPPVSPTTRAANLIYDANDLNERTGGNNYMTRNAQQEVERTREGSRDLQRLRQMVKDAERVGASDKDARTLKELVEEIERIEESGTQQDLNFQHHLISAATILSMEISTKRRAERAVARRYEESRHERSRRSPSPTLSETDQKVHYSRAPIEIIEEWSIPIENIKSPLRGILKKPTERFPEEPNPIREGVARLKDANLKKHVVPPSARWTKISRQLVNPEALEVGKERFEALPDSVIVLRPLSKAEIQEYAEATKRIRGICLSAYICNALTNTNTKNFRRSKVGLIHAVQGYDLNYVGVIIGLDLRFDPEQRRLFIDRDSYFDKKGKENNPVLGRTYSDDDLLRFITQIYTVLMTRGIRGTYVYSCDPGLREYLKAFVPARS